MPGLPEERNTTYAPNSQVKSDDLNDLQDLAVDHHEGIKNSSHRLIPMKISAMAFIFDDGGWSIESDGTIIQQEITEPARAAVHVRGGDRIEKISVRGTGTASFSLFRHDGGSSSDATDLGGGDFDTPSGGWESVSKDDYEEDVPDDEVTHYFIYVLSDDGVQEISGATVWLRRDQ